MDTATAGYAVEHDYELISSGDVLSLHHRSNHQLKPIVVDFSTQAMRKRLATHHIAELLPRALGIKQLMPNALVIDTTAGLGTDAFLLASLGCEVIAIERQRIVAELLRDGLRRACAQGGRIAEISNRIALVQADARAYLDQYHPIHEQATVIYLDPMFAPRRKSALGAHKLRALLAISGHDEDADTLLEGAHACATRSPQCKRVAVKRRLHAPSLCPGTPPSHHIKGRTVRFDVYMRSSKNHFGVQCHVAPQN